MRKLLMTAFAVGTVVFANAQAEQTFKPFKVDIAVGYALPSGEGSKAGALIAIEPKYALNDNLALGLRLETALTAQSDVSTTSGNADVKGSASYLATVDYYLNTNSFRPFVGAGAGIFSNASANANTNTETTSDVKAGSRFGYTPRIGFETGHFRAAVEYNVAGKTASVNHNYIGFKLGSFLAAAGMNNLSKFF